MQFIDFSSFDFFVLYVPCMCTRGRKKKTFFLLKEREKKERRNETAYLNCIFSFNLFKALKSLKGKAYDAKFVVKEFNKGLWGKCAVFFLARIEH